MTGIEQAEQNRAYVRMLLWQRQPAFATALAAAERYISCSACPFSQLMLESHDRTWQSASRPTARARVTASVRQCAPDAEICEVARELAEEAQDP
jgi:hypothetical protein